MNTTFTDLSATLLRGSGSDIGKRQNQEDRFAIRDYQTADGRPATLALVADGIGGHSSGEIASNMAEKMIPDLLLANPPSASETTRRLKAILEETGQAIYAESLVVPERSGMGTTCTAVCIIDRRLYLAHVGDSRAYLLRGGQLHQLTVDHTWAEHAIRAGRSPEEIKTHPNRGVIMRYLGIDPNIDVDARYRKPDGELVDGLTNGPFFLEPGDTLLLSTDGLSDTLDPLFLAEYMAGSDVQEAAQSLVRSALDAGATDNVTAVVVRLPGGAVVAPKPAAAPRAPKKLPLGALIAGAVALVALVMLGAILLSRAGAPAVATTAVAQATVAGSELESEPTRSARATRSFGGGVVEAATATATAPAATAPPTAPLLAAATITTTQELSGTLVAAAPGGEPTIIPTNTPVIQPTRPAATPRPDRTQPVAGASPTKGSGPTTSSGSISAGVRLIKPPSGEQIKGEMEFAWSDEPGFVLGLNEQYELIVWGMNESPMVAGRSPVGGTPLTTIKANLSGVERALGLQPSQLYYWGVRLLRAGQPVRMLSKDGNSFVYERASSGGDNPPPIIGGDTEK